jgi:O-antigen/teichoic acid export membrane protein
VNDFKAGLLRQSIAGVRWIAAGKFVFQVISWAMTVVVVRLLRPADYGLAALAGLVISTIGLLMDAGLGPGLVQHGAISKDVYRSANGFLLLAALTAMLLVCALADPIAHFFGEHQVGWILRVASVQFLLSALGVAANAQLSIRMRFRDLAVIQTLSGLAQGVATLALALGGAAFWSLIVGMLIGSLVRLALLLRFVDLDFGIKFSLAPLENYWVHARFLVAHRVAWTLADQSDQFIIGRWLGAVSLGFFSIAKNLSNMPLDRVAEIVNQVSLPVFSKVREDPERWNTGFEKLMRVSAAIAFPLFWGMAAVAPVALPMLLGPKWVKATVPFILLCLPLPLRTAQSLWSTALVGRGRSDLAFYAVAIWAAIVVPAFAMGTHWGLIGVSCAWVLAYPVIFLLSTLLISRSLKLRLSLFLRPLVAPALAATLSSASALGVGTMAVGIWPDVAVVTTQAAVGSLIYMLAFRLFSRAGYAEIFALVREFATR